MPYQYEIEPQDYSDFASGRVFYSVPGHPAFPVRLASEIFQHCMAHRAGIYHDSSPCTLYDPCCGTAYHLSVLAYLHGNQIREIIASDIDEKAVALAKRNLGLVTVAGLDQRIDEIAKLYEQYHKDSHEEALASAQMLKNRIAALSQDHPLTTRVFQANAMDKEAIVKNIGTRSVDLIFTDVPYGQHSQWHITEPSQSVNPIESMLDTLLGVLSWSSVVAIVSDKRQKGSHPSYQRVEQFQIGKRRVAILRPI